MSEALVFRHFRSKKALHAAVLRKLIEDQDETIHGLGAQEPSTGGIVTMLYRYFTWCVRGPLDSPLAAGPRVLLGSLSGDGAFARSVYRRAQRLTLPGFEAALKAAQASRDMVDDGPSAQNAMHFIEHVGTMLTASHLAKPPVVQYSGDAAGVVRQAVLFCGRGIGILDAALQREWPKSQRTPRDLAPVRRRA